MAARAGYPDDKGSGAVACGVPRFGFRVQGSGIELKVRYGCGLSVVRYQLSALRIARMMTAQLTVGSALLPFSTFSLIPYRMPGRAEIDQSAPVSHGCRSSYTFKLLNFYTIIHASGNKPLTLAVASWRHLYALARLFFPSQLFPYSLAEWRGEPGCSKVYRCIMGTRPFTLFNCYTFTLPAGLG